MPQEHKIPRIGTRHDDPRNRTNDNPPFWWMLNWREVIKSIDEQRKNQNILLFRKLLHMNQNNITSSKSLIYF